MEAATSAGQQDRTDVLGRRAAAALLDVILLAGWCGVRIVDGFPFLCLVGFLVAAFTPKKQRIGDLAAGTRVVRA